MKTPLKVTAAVSLAAAILLGGPAMATAAPAAESESNSLTKLITLKPDASVKVSSTLGESPAAGGPWISSAYPLNSGAFAASPMLTAGNGSTWRQISVQHCGVQGAFYMSDADVATERDRPAGSDVKDLQVGPVSGPAEGFSAQFTGIATLAPEAGIYTAAGDKAPLYLTADAPRDVPATPAFEQGGEMWQGILSAGLIQGVVKVADVAAFELTTCGPIPPTAFADTASTTTTDTHDAAATATVESSEQGGNPAPGIWMIAGGAVAFTAFIATMIVRANKTENVTK